MKADTPFGKINVVPKQRGKKKEIGEVMSPIIKTKIQYPQILITGNNDELGWQTEIVDEVAKLKAFPIATSLRTAEQIRMEMAELDRAEAVVIWLKRSFPEHSLLFKLGWLCARGIKVFFGVHHKHPYKTDIMFMLDRVLRDKTYDVFFDLKVAVKKWIRRESAYRRKNQICISKSLSHLKRPNKRWSASASVATHDFLHKGETRRHAE